MKKQKIYLETSVFGRYFEIDRSHHKDTVDLFEACAAGRFEPFTSQYVIGELTNAPCEKRIRMLELIEQYNIKILPQSDEVNKLAWWYISKGALPKKSLQDARHIAITSVNALDIIVSLNFKHIVRRKTIKLINTANIVLGYKTVEIKSPTDVIKNGK
jgi:predicted nucleic acid-binding protein